MERITGFTKNAHQSFTISLEDETTFDLTLRFLPSQNTFILDVAGEDFKLTGLRVVTSANMLAPFRQKIKFGLAVLTKDLSEPYFQNDFSSGRVEMFILNNLDLRQVNV